MNSLVLVKQSSLLLHVLYIKEEMNTITYAVEVKLMKWLLHLEIVHPYYSSLAGIWRKHIKCLSALDCWDSGC